MGAWGTGIFDDDTACDVRTEYLELLMNGITDEDATGAMIELNSDEADDEDCRIMFWTALAAIQWEVGRLDDSVKERTLALIEEGDSPLWLEQKDSVEERKAVLEELRNKLLSRQPPRMDQTALSDYCARLESAPVCEQEESNDSPEQTRKWWQFWK